MLENAESIYITVSANNIPMAVVSIGKKGTNVSDSPIKAQPLPEDSPIMAELAPIFSFFAFESPLQWARSQPWGKDLDPKVAADRDKYIPAYEKEQLSVLEQFHQLLKANEAQRGEIIATVLTGGRGDLVVEALKAAQQLEVDGLAGPMMELFVVTSHAGRMAIFDYLKEWIQPSHYPHLLELAGRFTGDEADREYKAGLNALRAGLAEHYPTIAWAEAALQGITHDPAPPEHEEAWAMMKTMPDFEQVWQLARGFQAGATNPQRKALYDLLGQVLMDGLNEKGVPEEALRAGLIVLGWEAQGPLPAVFGTGPLIINEAAINKLSQWFHRVGAEVRKAIFTSLPTAAAARLARTSLDAGGVQATRQTMALIPDQLDLVPDLAPALLDLVKHNDQFGFDALLLLRGERVHNRFADEIGWWTSYFLHEEMRAELTPPSSITAEKELETSRLPILADYVLEEVIPLTPGLLRINERIFEVLVQRGLKAYPDKLAQLALESLQSKTVLAETELQRLEQLLQELPLEDSDMEPFIQAAATAVADTAFLRPEMVRQHWDNFPEPLSRGAFESLTAGLRKIGPTMQLRQKAGHTLNISLSQSLPPALMAWQENGEALVEAALDHVASHPGEADALAQLLPDTITPVMEGLIQKLAAEGEEEGPKFSGKELLAAWSELTKVAEEMAAGDGSRLVSSHGSDLERRLAALEEDLRAAVAQAEAESEAAEDDDLNKGTPGAADMLRRWAAQAASQKTKAARAEGRLNQLWDRLLGELGIVMEVMTISAAGTEAATAVTPYLDKLFNALTPLQVVPVAQWQSTVAFNPLRHRAGRGTTAGTLVQVLVPGLMTQGGQVIRLAVCEE